MNWKIVFIFSSQEAFSAAKLAFTSYKMRVRSNLSVTHMGPETLEEAVQDYINRNTDLYDLPALVSVSICITMRVILTHFLDGFSLTTKKSSYLQISFYILYKYTCPCMSG